MIPLLDFITKRSLGAKAKCMISLKEIGRSGQLVSLLFTLISTALKTFIVEFCWLINENIIFLTDLNKCSYTSPRWQTYGGKSGTGCRTSRFYFSACPTSGHDSKVKVLYLLQVTLSHFQSISSEFGLLCYWNAALLAKKKPCPPSAQFKILRLENSWRLLCICNISSLFPEPYPQGSEMVDPKVAERPPARGTRIAEARSICTRYFSHPLFSGWNK